MRRFLADTVVPPLAGASVTLPQRLAPLGPGAIVLLGLSTALYQPVGPDVFVISSSLIGLSPSLAATLALVSTWAGGTLGYAFGRGFLRAVLGRVLRRRQRGIEKARAWLNRRGWWFVALAGFTPIPLTQVAWAAGTLRMSFPQFAVAMFAGLAPRFALEALFSRQLHAWIT